MLKNKEAKKTKKTKTIQMRYPAPYSWSQTGSYDRKPTVMKKSASYDSKNKYTKLKAPTTCCDPYAPHLKYGIFPQKNLKAIESSNENLKKVSSVQQVSKDDGNVQDSDEPYFIIRPLNKHYMQQLSLSQVLHMDIEPKFKKSQIRSNSSLRFNK